MERFWAKVAIKGPNECWLWTASRLTAGYGRFNLGGVNTPAHRVAYELSVGPIPDRHDIHHVCGVKGCVNPMHLKVVTRGEHHAIEPRNQRRDGFCRRGHFAGTSRKCSQCRRENYRALREQGLSGTEAARRT